MIYTLPNAILNLFLYHSCLALEYKGFFGLFWGLFLLFFFSSFILYQLAVLKLLDLSSTPIVFLFW